MFNFLHPRPVVDGRAVAIQLAEQKAQARQDTRTLIVSTQGTTPAKPAVNGNDAAKQTSSATGRQ